jgi:hypothetical protein
LYAKPQLQNKLQPDLISHHANMNWPCGTEPQQAKAPLCMPAFKICLLNALDYNKKISTAESWNILIKMLQLNAFKSER